MIKNKLLTNKLFSKCKNSRIKEKLSNDYKYYRNMISILIKQSKKVTMTSILKIISTTWKIPGKESENNKWIIKNN